MNLYFSHVENVDIWVSRASSVLGIGHKEQARVGSNFTQQSDNFYVLVTPSKDAGSLPAKKPQAKFTFKFYQKYWEFSQLEREANSKTSNDSSQSGGKGVNGTERTKAELEARSKAELALGFNRSATNVTLLDGYRYF